MSTTTGFSKMGVGYIEFTDQDLKDMELLMSFSEPTRRIDCYNCEAMYLVSLNMDNSYCPVCDALNCHGK